ncbi:MAG: BMP family ABC transporter substrate-binding protein [Oligoflexales bacterium]
MRSLVWVMFFTVSFISAYGSPKYDAAMVYTFDGKGDKTFNDLAHEGVEKARKDLGLKIKEIEGWGKKGTIKKAEKAIKKGVPLLIFLSYALRQIVADLSEKYPKVHFAIIDSIVDAPNVKNIVFKEQEGSFLVGYLAGKFSEKPSLGFVGGVPIPVLKRFESGFRQGIKKANAKKTLHVDYIGNDNNAWINPSKAKELTHDQFRKGADIVFAVAGGSGMGVIEAAQEAKKFAIGVDVNQNHLAPGRILTSMVKRIDQAIFNILADHSKGIFTVGTTKMGIKELGVSCAIDEHTKSILKSKGKSEVIAEVRELEEQIKNGKIQVKE